METRRNLIGIFMAMLALGVLGSCAGPVAQKPYQLKFEKGKNYYVRMITDRKITYTTDRGEWATEQTIGFGNNFDVKSVDENGKAWIKYTYDWVKSRYNWGRGEVEYDSSKSDSATSPAREGFGALLGQSFLLKITPEGQVEQVKGLEDVRNSVLQKLRQAPDERMKNYRIESLRQQLSEEAIKELIESAMAIYPRRVVKVGDSWSKKTIISWPLPMILENEWTLKKRKDKVAFIEVKSTIRPNPGGKPLVIDGTEIGYELSGQQDGLIEMAESTGRIICSTINQQASGSMRIKSERTGPEGTSWLLDMHGTITFEMTERNN